MAEAYPLKEPEKARGRRLSKDEYEERASKAKVYVRALGESWYADEVEFEGSWLILKGNVVKYDEASGTAYSHGDGPVAIHAARVVSAVDPPGEGGSGWTRVATIIAAFLLLLLMLYALTHREQK